MKYKQGQIVKKFKTNKGREVLIRAVNKNDLKELLRYINELSKEDIYLIVGGREITEAEERKFLKETIEKIKKGEKLYLTVFYQGKMIGSGSFEKGKDRTAHTASLGLAISKGFREEGIGTELLKILIKEAKKLEVRILYLGVFAENKKAIKLYKKFGFKEYGRLPAGLFYKERYIDHIFMYKNL